MNQCQIENKSIGNFIVTDKVFCESIPKLKSIVGYNMNKYYLRNLMSTEIDSFISDAYIKYINKSFTEDTHFFNAFAKNIETKLFRIKQNNTKKESIDDDGIENDDDNDRLDFLMYHRFKLYSESDIEAEDKKSVSYIEATEEKVLTTLRLVNEQQFATSNTKANNSDILKDVLKGNCTTELLVEKYGYKSKSSARLAVFNAKKSMEKILGENSALKNKNLLKYKENDLIDKTKSFPIYKDYPLEFLKFKVDLTPQILWVINKLSEVSFEDILFTITRNKHINDDDLVVYIGKEKRKQPKVETYRKNVRTKLAQLVEKGLVIQKDDLYFIK
jgi:hypothetical protein